MKHTVNHAKLHQFVGELRHHLHDDQVTPKNSFYSPKASRFLISSERALHISTIPEVFKMTTEAKEDKYAIHAAVREGRCMSTLV